MHNLDVSKSQSEVQEKRVPYLEYADPQTMTNVKNLASPRLLKSHLPYHLLPQQLKEKKNKVEKKKFNCTKQKDTFRCYTNHIYLIVLAVQIK